MIVLIIFSLSMIHGENINLRPRGPAIPAQSQNEINLDQYKNIELNKKNLPSGASCMSVSGAEYKPDSPNFESCVRENSQTPDVYKKEQLDFQKKINGR